ncbi:MAG: tRNA pseudouridine(13) synthase TruD [Planctomycetia bacterium]|nr:tRNA pseudouridine(13) synthase TruD [Planctomycetia bacterium]
MPVNPLAPPLLTANLPGIGGRIRQFPEDFEVEEIPAYEPSGTGDYLYLWIEKRELGAEYFVRQLAHKLDLPPGEVGTAGLKDRHAVTRQMVSVPARVESLLERIDGDGMKLLKIDRHGNKLKTGHLHGNRFRILVREPVPEAAERLPLLLERLKAQGLPNYYGPQRFGHNGETLRIGLDLLHQTPGAKVPRSPFMRKLTLSAAQSALFNDYLGRRLTDGLLRQVLPGDVMAKRPFGGMFVAEDLPTEQRRFEAGETVPAGPIFGRKTFRAAGLAAEREAAVLAEAGLTPASFAGFGKLVQGTRRHNLVFLDDLAAVAETDGIRLTFTLPAGSYATVLLQEIMKTQLADSDATD